MYGNSANLLRSPRPRCVGTDADCANHTGYFGRSVRSAEHCCANLRRVVRPQRARPLLMRTPRPARAKITRAGDGFFLGSNPVVREFASSVLSWVLACPSPGGAVVAMSVSGLG